MIAIRFRCYFWSSEGCPIFSLAQLTRVSSQDAAIESAAGALEESKRRDQHRFIAVQNYDTL